MYVPIAAIGWAFGEEGSPGQAADLMNRSGLQPIIDAFPGASLGEKLASGYVAARASLAKYSTKLTFDPIAAEDLLSEISTWQERNQKTIDEMMKDPNTDTLPEQIAFKFGPEKGQQLVVAGFAEAARGLGPWLGGDIAANFKTDPQIPEKWVKADARERLITFASIVKMDAEGDLFKIFKPEEYAQAHPVSGLGFLPALVAAVGPTLTIVFLSVVVLGTVALVLNFIHSMKRLQANNKIMAERCKAAEERGDKELVKICIQAAASAQAEPSGPEALMKTVATYAILGGLLYTVSVVVLPKVAERMLEKKT
jgi:hypothetical protein